MYVHIKARSVSDQCSIPRTPSRQYHYEKMSWKALSTQNSSDHTTPKHTSIE